MVLLVQKNPLLLNYLQSPGLHLLQVVPIYEMPLSWHSLNCTMHDLLLIHLTRIDLAAHSFLDFQWHLLAQIGHLLHQDPTERVCIEQYRMYFKHKQSQRLKKKNLIGVLTCMLTSHLAGYLHMDLVGQEVLVYQVFLQSQWLQGDHPTQELLVFHLDP